MTRIFLALERNEDAQRYLAEVIREMAQALPGVRWVDPSSIHLTLAFLGELTDAQLPKVMQATELAASQTSSFSYSLSKISFFGSRNNPRIIWMGINEPTGTLTRLHALLNKELLRQGFEVDSRPFSPHLTLARVKASLSYAEKQRLQELLNRRERVVSREYQVLHIDVMKSELLRTGAKYTCLKAYNVAG